MPKEFLALFPYSINGSLLSNTIENKSRRIYFRERNKNEHLLVNAHLWRKGKFSSSSLYLLSRSFSRLTSYILGPVVHVCKKTKIEFFAFMNYFFINWSFRHRHRLMTKRVFSIHASFIHSNFWQRFCYCEWDKILQSPRESLP